MQIKTCCLSFCLINEFLNCKMSKCQKRTFLAQNQNQHFALRLRKKKDNHFLEKLFITDPFVNMMYGKFHGKRERGKELFFFLALNCICGAKNPQHFSFSKDSLVFCKRKKYSNEILDRHFTATPFSFHPELRMYISIKKKE